MLDPMRASPLNAKIIPLVPGSTPDEVWTRYRDNMARYLMGIARDLQHRSMTQLAGERGYAALRPSLGPLLSLIALEARPLGTLAQRLSISPQACSQLVNIAEAAGYLVRRAAPHDGRSRVIALTALGQALVKDAGEILASIEADYQRLIPERDFSRFSEALRQLFNRLDLAAEQEAGLVPTGEIGLGTLPLISLHVQRELMATTARAGHDGLKMSHAQVLPLIGPDGARVAALARIQKVSRQAISATARDLESLGVLRREADPRDRRGVVFCLTSSGQKLIEDSVAALDLLDESLRKSIGSRRFGALEHGARSLYQALRLEDEVFIGEHTPPLKLASAKGTAQPEELKALATRLRSELGHEQSIALAALLAGDAPSKSPKNTDARAPRTRVRN